MPLALPADTPRLRFRLFRADDLPIARGLWGDPEVTRFIGGELDDAAVAAKLDEEMARAGEFGVQYWPVFLRDSGEHVGCCGLRPREEGVLELGFHLRAAFWGRGLAREAASAVIAFAFDELGASWLFAGHHPENAGSRGLLLALGFRRTHDELYPPTGLLHPSYRLDRTQI